MNRYWVVTILVFGSLGLAACGGGGRDKQVATPGITEQPASPVVGTPGQGFTVIDNLFEPADGGYSVQLPEGWTPEPNFLPSSGHVVDAFFAPGLVQGVQPNISVTCEELPEGAALRDYFNEKMDVEKRVAQVEPEISSREVSGREALVFRFARENTKPPLEKTEVIFITGSCGWSISLTVPYSEAASYHDLFDKFLASFTALR
jgi:hypothetical protein